ncbi:MAG: putative toxin-antitoxin system toxin component, PIN family [Anaerolineae bacterium]|nr:putative toxin-antitoxin system toxin component, PIN family [Anaerolineae bacterium]
MPISAVLDTNVLISSLIVPPPPPLPGVTRDPKDDPVVACAVAGNADYVVSGDQDILALHVYGAVRMVTPAQFVQLLGG